MNQFKFILPALIEAATVTLGRDYEAAIHRLHDLGIMINGSFVYGLDDDDAGVFDRTVNWAIDMGITTSTFHIATPYPGTASPTSLDQFELTLPYPVEKGHSYVAEGEKYEVIATDETIKVPAGEFTCTVYQTLYDEDPDYITRQLLYMAKGVGLVRWKEYEKAVFNLVLRAITLSIRRLPFLSRCCR